MWGLLRTITAYSIKVGLLCGFVNLQAVYTVEHTHVGAHGTVIASSTDHINNATVEKVVFYPKESEHSEERIERNGILVRYPEAIGTVLICHGFMCDKFDVGFLRSLFPRGKYNTFAFDFRGHGEKKKGQRCTLGPDEALDVEAAAQFLKNNPALQGKPLFVYGFSMGAVAAIEAQAKQPLFTAMILDCPFDSTENIIKRGLESLKISLFGYTFYVPGRNFLQRYAFHPYVQSLLKLVLKTVANMDTRDIVTRVKPIDPVKTVAKVTVPCLFISCKKDEKVSIAAIKEIHTNAGSQYKVLLLTNGRGHYDSYFYNPERYKDAVRSFLAKSDMGQLNVSWKEIIEDSDDQII